MGFGKSIKKEYNHRKEAASNDELLNTQIRRFNENTLRALDQFNEAMESGELKVTNYTEFARIFLMSKEINELGKLLEEGGTGNGALPPINRGQANVIQKAINEGHMESEGDNIDLESMDDADVDELATALEFEKNKENGGTV